MEQIIEIDDLDDFYYKIEDNILYWSEYGIEELEEKRCDISVLNDLKDFYKDRLANKKCLIVFD